MFESLVDFINLAALGGTDGLLKKYNQYSTELSGQDKLEQTKQEIKETLEAYEIIKGNLESYFFGKKYVPRNSNTDA